MPTPNDQQNVIVDQNGSPQRVQKIMMVKEGNESDHLSSNLNTDIQTTQINNQ